MDQTREMNARWPRREQAEHTRPASETPRAETRSPEEFHALLHDLRVHQIELEVQNEELRRAQAELEASWARYVELYESAPVGYLTLEGKGAVHQANLRAAHMLGVSRKELIDQLLARFVAPEDQDIYYLSHRKIVRSGMSRECELRMVRSDHTRLWVRMDMSAAQEGEFVHVSLCDITNSKLAEQERRELMAKLEESQRLESLGMLAGGVAHDFNNLLMGIMGNAHLVASDLPPDSPNQPVIEDVLSASEQAAALTTQMLAYAGKGHVELRPIDLNALLRDTSSLLESAVSKRVRLELDLSAELPAIEGDLTQIRQVALNLVTNASEACNKEGGVVTLKTRIEDSEDERFPGGRSVVLECGDTGCGMDEETRARVFEPFFTTKATGRGLGLAAMEGIVRAHHGKIMVDSCVGVGTRFTLMFPTFERPFESVGVDVAPCPERASSCGAERLLVVEDSPEVLALVARILRRAGYEVITASGGIEGLGLARRHTGRLDLVILDVVMPDLSGPEVAEILKSEQRDLEIMLTTGFTPASLSEIVYETEMEVLKKPYHPDTLLRRVRAMLDAKARPRGPSSPWCAERGVLRPEPRHGP